MTEGEIAGMTGIRNCGNEGRGALHHTVCRLSLFSMRPTLCCSGSIPGRRPRRTTCDPECFVFMCLAAASYAALKPGAMRSRRYENRRRAASYAALKLGAMRSCRYENRCRAASYAALKLRAMRSRCYEREGEGVPWNVTLQGTPRQEEPGSSE